MSEKDYFELPTEILSSADYSFSVVIDDCDEMDLSLDLKTFDSPISTGWTEKDEQRFDSLAEAEALDEITTEELAELNKLSRRRSNLLTPYTAEEIQLRQEIKKETREAILAIKRLIARFSD